MVWTVADLRALAAVAVGPSEIVYAFVSLLGQPSPADEALLDDEETVRAHAFARPADRYRFVLAHAALRLLLGRCLGVPPEEVAYELGPHGKPGLHAEGSAPEFNLSHSGELGLVAISRGPAVGVDVEQERELTELLEIADQQFSAEERVALRALPAAEQPAAFFRCWTRKEAVIKAGGEGLGYPLGSFDVELAPGSLSALTRYGGRTGADLEVSLRDLGAPAGYAAAGAVMVPPSAGVPWRELGGRG